MEHGLPPSFVQRIFASVPRTLCLLDKNPLSPTYGCLDRKYWQYKILDFPSGMQQELARVLAFAYCHPQSPWKGVERIKDFACASIDFTARHTNTDGSLDDYFPYERALGATAYSLAAVTDACRLLGWVPEGDTLRGLQRMGTFLANHDEVGLLANHHAIAAYGLYSLARLFNAPQFAAFAQKKIRFLESIQRKEGWFPEYEGCDIGYQTVTLEFLARCQQLVPDSVSDTMLFALVAFLRDFVHPDGSLGGEYGSRNTYNFYPGGFALLSARNSSAAEMMGLYLYGVEHGTNGYLEDDGTFGHMLSSSITAVEADVRICYSPCSVHQKPWIQEYAEAQFWRGGVGRLSMYGAMTKGGGFKLFREQQLVCSDTGYAGRLHNGQVFCQNNPHSSHGKISQESDKITLFVHGQMKNYKTKRLTLFSMTALRILCLLFGKCAFFSRAIRKLMQSVIVYSKPALPIDFTRTIRIQEEGISIQDTVRHDARHRIQCMYLTSDCVNAHVVTSDSFQYANMLSWVDASDFEGDTYSSHRFFRKNDES